MTEGLNAFNFNRFWDFTGPPARRSVRGRNRSATLFGEEVMTTRHPAARRVHQQTAEPDDAFIARLLELTAWARANATLLFIAALVVIVGATAGLYYTNYQRTMRAQAATQLNEVRMTAASGNNALAIRDLETFISSFGATSAGDEARILLAQAYLADGQPEKAATAVEALAADPAAPMGATAAFLLGAAFEASGSIDQAESAYLRIADRSRETYLKAEALDQAARLRLDQGQAGVAVQRYEQLLGMLPATAPERGIYEMRLSEARVRARTPAAN